MLDNNMKVQDHKKQNYKIKYNYYKIIIIVHHSMQDRKSNSLRINKYNINKQLRV